MNAIELHQAQKRYSDFTLGPITFSLPAGCILGLVGENGAGKTTTIKLLLNLIRRDGGSVQVLGKDPAQSGPALKEDLGVVLDEVGFPDCITPAQLDRVLHYTYARWDSGRYHSLLHRFQLPEKKPVSDFSIGMKMKLGLAAALSHDPKLLILDEATSGLDPVVRDEVLELIYDFTRQEDHSVLFSSHIVGDLEKLCDYVAFLHRGQLLLWEEKDALLENYAMVSLPLSQLEALPKAAVLGKRQTPYGVEVLVKKENLPAGFTAGAVSLEELFVLLIKGRELR